MHEKDMGMRQVREIIGNIKRFPNFFRGFALDHVCYRFATSIKERLNIQIICSLKGG